MTETLKWKLCRSQFFLAWINGGGHRKMNFGDDQSGEFFFNSESCLTVIFSSVFNVILSRMSFYFWKKLYAKIDGWTRKFRYQLSTFVVYFISLKKKKDDKKNSNITNQHSSFLSFCFFSFLKLNQEIQISTFIVSLKKKMFQHNHWNHHQICVFFSSSLQWETPYFNRVWNLSRMFLLSASWPYSSLTT